MIAVYSAKRFALLAALSVAAMAATADRSNAQTGPSDGAFCQKLFEGISRVVDDFGAEQMYRSVGGDNSARIAGVLVDENFQRQFGLRVMDIPPEHHRAWVVRMRECPETNQFRAAHVMHRSTAQNLSNMIGFVFEKRDLPPYRSYLAAIAAHDRMRQLLSGDLPPTEGTLDGYLTALRQQAALVKELAIIPPSEAARVTDRLASQRRTILEAVIMAEDKAATVAGSSVVDLSKVLPSALPPETASVSQDERALLVRLRDIRVRAAREVIGNVLKNASDDEERLRLTREMVRLLPREQARRPVRRTRPGEVEIQPIPDGIDSVRTTLLVARRQALGPAISALGKEIEGAEDLKALAALGQRYRDVFDQRLDGNATQGLVAAVRAKEKELRQIAYRQECEAYLSQAKIAKKSQSHKVIGPNGTVELWALACGMRDRGTTISSFSEPGFFGSTYVLKATTRQGDVITVKMKQAEAGSGKALVGIDLTDAVETKPFTLDSWKTFVASAYRG